MINDTINNSRHKKILQILKNGIKLSREEISNKLSKDYIISRITLIRDLKELVSRGLLASEGKARFTKYFIANLNPLLEYLDLDDYFSKEIDERNIKKVFNSDIFKNLENLYSEQEISLWEKSKNEYSLRSKKLDPTLYKRELERFIIEFAWKSSQIEGNTYDLLETETLLVHNIQANGHSEEEAVMIVNHKKAFDLILENKESFKKVSFSDITQLHNILMEGLITTGIRNQPVRITGTNYKPPELENDLRSNLHTLVEVLDKTPFIPDKALIALCMIAYLQPFKDGNKRTSRMLSNAILISHGYFPLSYRNVDLNEYRKSIIVFYEQNNISNLKRITISQLRFAIENYFII